MDPELLAQLRQMYALRQSTGPVPANRVYETAEGMPTGPDPMAELLARRDALVLQQPPNPNPNPTTNARGQDIFAPEPPLPPPDPQHRNIVYANMIGHFRRPRGSNNR